MLSDRLEMMSREFIKGIDEAASSLEESLFDHLDTRLEVVDVEVRHRYILVIHQLRPKEDGVRQTTSEVSVSQNNRTSSRTQLSSQSINRLCF